MKMKKGQLVLVTEKGNVTIWNYARFLKHAFYLLCGLLVVVGSVVYYHMQWHVKDLQSGTVRPWERILYS